MKCGEKAYAKDVVMLGFPRLKKTLQNKFSKKEDILNKKSVTT